MFPDSDKRLVEIQIVLVFTNKIAGRIMKPVQATVAVAGHDQTTISVIGIRFTLRLTAQICMTISQAPHGVEIELDDTLAIELAIQTPGFRIVLIASRASVEPPLLQQAAKRIVVKVGALFVLVLNVFLLLQNADVKSIRMLMKDILLKCFRNLWKTV